MSVCDALVDVAIRVVNVFVKFAISRILSAAATRDRYYLCDLESAFVPEVGMIREEGYRSGHRCAIQTNSITHPEKVF